MSEVYTPSDDALKEIYRTARTIAVVGASTNRTKPAHNIPRYLKEQGFRIVPVNPSAEEILGEPTVGKLTDIGEPVDVVDVFRPAEETPDVARDAVAIGAKVLWLQEGIYNDEARRIAEEAGLTVVMGRCMGETHWELVGEGAAGSDG
jgi:predicted CoA-binding protein